MVVDSYQTGSSRDLHLDVCFGVCPPAMDFHEHNDSHKPVGSSRRIVGCTRRRSLRRSAVALQRSKEQGISHPTRRQFEQEQPAAGKQATESRSEARGTEYPRTSPTGFRRGASKQSKVFEVLTVRPVRQDQDSILQIPILIAQRCSRSSSTLFIARCNVTHPLPLRLRA